MQPTALAHGETTTKDEEKYSLERPVWTSNPGKCLLFKSFKCNSQNGKLQLCYAKVILNVIIANNVVLI